MLAAKIGYFRSAVHPDVANWLARVATNGGSVSASTITAVTAFCTAIDTAGIRSKFYRCNLFCGSGLSAALVPLYVATAPGGTTLGNTVDQNNGPFVAANYTETGASGGLNKPDGATTKYLETGLATNAFPQFTRAHVAASFAANATVTAGFLLAKGAPGNYNNSGTDSYYLYIASANHNAGLCQATSTGEVVSTQSIYARYISSRTASNLATTYRNGSSVATNASTVTAPTTSTATLKPFTLNNSALCRMHYYSFGDSLTGTQAAALDTAFSAFLTAMGRS